MPVGVERADAARNRAAILRATEELLAREDAEHVSVDAVAAAAGVGKGTVFRRFGSRAGLLRALVDERMDDLSRRIRTGPPPLGPGAPAVDRLTAFFDAVVDVASRNSALISAYEYAAAGPQRSAAAHAAGPQRSAAAHAAGPQRSAATRATASTAGNDSPTPSDRDHDHDADRAGDTDDRGSTGVAPGAGPAGSGPAGTTATQAATDAYAWWYEHLTALIAEARPDLDAELVGHVLLGSLHAPPIRTLLADGSADRVRDTMRRLVTDLLAAPRR
jgi:AcrR family transcriptional regulator